MQKIFELWCEVSTEEAPADAAANTSHPSGSGGSAGGGASGAAAAVVMNHPIVHQFPDQFGDSRVLADIPQFAFPCEFEK